MSKRVTWCRIQGAQRLFFYAAPAVWKKYLLKSALQIPLLLISQLYKLVFFFLDWRSLIPDHVPARAYDST
jgi:hypothetical protein